MDRRWVQMDIAKGLGILIIVFGHGWFVARSPEFMFPLLSPFILPLFFFLSGVLFNLNKGFAETFVEKADALLKPFFVTMLLYVVLRAIWRGNSLWQDIAGILYGSVQTIPWQALWYLPHFWLVMIYSWVVLRTLKALQVSDLQGLSIVVLQLMFGVWLLGWSWQMPVDFAGTSYVLPGLPFSADVLLTSSAFFIAGFFFRSALRKHQSSVMSLAISALIFGMVFYLYPTSMDLAQRRYEHWFWTTLSGVSGVYLCWAISGVMEKVSWLSRAMIYVGQSSLIILIFHGEIQNKAFAFLRIQLGSDIWAALIALLLSVMACLAIAQGISRVAVLRWFYWPLRLQRKSAAKVAAEGAPS